MRKNLNPFYTLFILLLAFGTAKATDQSTLEESIAGPYFSILPREIIPLVGKNLFDKNFKDFAATCRYIRTSLHQAKELFMPEGEDNIVAVIKRTPISSIPQLGLTWSRSPKEITISTLRRLLATFIDFSDEKKALTERRESFKNYVKTLNLLHVQGDPQITDTFKNLYDQIQRLLTDNLNFEDDGSTTIENPEAYFFYLRNGALLSHAYRESLAKFYSEGYTKDNFTFHKNETKEIKYRTPLTLPLLISLTQ
ncbi:MAG: hypothetical protein IBJ00_08085 [Alphaproteobacteria bacterium]|nr:hypothetical protein [Alphaproteobacteria bacterium]